MEDSVYPSSESWFQPNSSASKWRIASPSPLLFSWDGLSKVLINLVRHLRQFFHIRQVGKSSKFRCWSIFWFGHKNIELIRLRSHFETQHATKKLSYFHHLRWYRKNSSGFSWGTKKIDISMPCSSKSSNWIVILMVESLICFSSSWLQFSYC